MIADITTQVTDAIYVGLFGFNIQTANDHLGLLQGTDEETRRDHMGRLALEALIDTENAMTASFRQLPRFSAMSMATLLNFAERMAAVTAEAYAERGVKGRDLLMLDEVGK